MSGLFRKCSYVDIGDDACRTGNGLRLDAALGSGPLRSSIDAAEAPTGAVGAAGNGCRASNLPLSAGNTRNGSSQSPRLSVARPNLARSVREGAG